MNKAAQAYFQTNVSTTDQGQLLILLYDGALKFLQLAREKMLEKDYAAKGIYISKVIDIINELANTLNLEKGGSLAENLNNLYFLCTTRLLQANLKMNVEQLDTVVHILSGLRSAYAQIIVTPEARQISSEIAAKLKTDASLTQRAAITPRAATPTVAGQAGQRQARAAYGQQATSIPFPAQGGAAQPQTSPQELPVQEPKVQAAPVQEAQPVATPQAAVQQALAPAAPAQPAPVQPASTQPVQPTAPKAPPAAYSPSASPAATAPKGFGLHGKNFFKSSSI